MNKTLVAIAVIIGAIVMRFAFADVTKQPDLSEIANRLDQLNAKLDTLIQAQAKLDTIITKQDQTMEMLRMRRLHT